MILTAIILALPVAFMVFNIWAGLEIATSGYQRELALKLLGAELLILAVLFFYGLLMYNHLGDLLGWVITTFILLEH